MVSGTHSFQHDPAATVLRGVSGGSGIRHHIHRREVIREVAVDRRAALRVDQQRTVHLTGTTSGLESTRAWNDLAFGEACW